MTPGETLRHHRVASGLTQAALAKALGMTSQHVSALEIGVRPLHGISHASFQTICAALKLDDAGEASLLEAVLESFATSSEWAAILNAKAKGGSHA